MKATGAPARDKLLKRQRNGDEPAPSTKHEHLYEIMQADCMAWLEERASNSIHAIVTDPPYGLKEYTATEKHKLRNKHGGVWRIPPKLDGYERQPLNVVARSHLALTFGHSNSKPSPLKPLLYSHKQTAISSHSQFPREQRANIAEAVARVHGNRGGIVPF